MTDFFVPDWSRGPDDDQRHPQPPPGESLFSAWYVAPRAEQRNRARIIAPARPASVRICGPITGSLTTTDPDLLRAEAARLLDVADTLELVQEATATTLFGPAA